MKNHCPDKTQKDVYGDIAFRSRRSSKDITKDIEERTKSA